MYFSVINPATERVRAAVHDMTNEPYDMHRWLWKFFGGDKDAERDFIFRRHDLDGLPRFYVVSARQPVAFSDDWEVQTRPYSPQPAAGQRLSFVLCANPVVSKKDAHGKSRRYDVMKYAKKALLREERPEKWELVAQTCLAWLQARAEKAGFELVGASADAHRSQEAHKRDVKPIQFSSVEFSGELIVRDPQAFQRTLLQGLGHAKAFGCGLMLVKPIVER